ncbi:MAG TPA: hypothetical protein VGB92_16505 [Longimicrobium sp.]|jgi:hypothetical protein
MTIDEYHALPWTVHERAGAQAEALFPVVLKEYIAAAGESGHAPAVPAARA